MTTTAQARAKRRAAATSIGVNIGLLTMKIVVGVITGSIALWASAADSLLDLTASIFARGDGGFGGPAEGFIDMWGIYDTGFDNLGADRRDVPPSTQCPVAFM